MHGAVGVDVGGGEDLRGIVRPVAVPVALLVAPAHQQLVVDVEGADPVVGAARVFDGDPEGVLVQDLVGAHHDDVVAAVQDQRWPALPNGHRAGVGVGARRQLGDGFLQGGPAELVEQARAQGFRQQGNDVQVADPSGRFGCVRPCLRCPQRVHLR
ncbi:hypothetical protein ACFQ1S_04795, partial [Kibdelosporangium lantanae]